MTIRLGYDGRENIGKKKSKLRSYLMAYLLLQTILNMSVNLTERAVGEMPAEMRHYDIMSPKA